MQSTGGPFKTEKLIKAMADVTGTARRIAEFMCTDTVTLTGRERAQAAAAAGKLAAAGADMASALLTASCAARLVMLRLPCRGPAIACAPAQCGKGMPVLRLADTLLRDWQDSAATVLPPCAAKCETRPAECARCTMRSVGTPEALVTAYTAALQVFSGWVCVYLLARYERAAAAGVDAEPAAGDSFLAPPANFYTSFQTTVVQHAKQSIEQVSGAGLHDALAQHVGSFYVALYAGVCRPHATRRVDVTQLYHLASIGAEVIRVSGAVPVYMEDVPTRTMRLYVWARCTGNHARVSTEFAALVADVAERTTAWLEGARLSLAMSLRDRAPIAVLGQDILMMVAAQLQTPFAPTPAI